MTSQKKKSLQYGELTDLVFEAIANNLIEMKWGYKPRLPVILGHIIKYILEVKKVKIKEGKLRKKISDLEKKDIIEIDNREDTVFVRLKEKGERKIIKYSLQLLLDYKKKEKKWDGKWFFVFFDVPEEQRIKRDYLRKLLKELGFYQYQQSVYIFPYECKQEILFIKRIVESAKYMKYIIAETIEDEIQVKKHFRLE